MEADIYEGLNEKIFALESQLHKAEADNADLLLELYYQGLDAEIAEKMRDRFEADNAALLKIVKEYYSKAMWEYHREMSAAGLKDTFLELQEIIDSPHPGAALLEELKQLRAVRSAAEELHFWNSGLRYSETYTELVCKLADALAAVKGSD
jgi:hypothetical protein